MKHRIYEVPWQLDLFLCNVVRNDQNLVAERWSRVPRLLDYVIELSTRCIWQCTSSLDAIPLIRLPDMILCCLQKASALV
jgi:hypothetical protein